MSEAPATLRTAREATIDALCDGFARDELSLGELERRLARAREAQTREELRSLLDDLQRPPAPVPTRPQQRKRMGAEPADATSARPRSIGDVPARRGSHLAIAVMGGTRRSGKWEPPGNMLAMAIMGGVELDFREAILGPGVTEINVFAFWGGIEITVPPGVFVDTHGMAIMGAFEEDAELESEPPADAPTIRVNGIAIMAGVEIRVRRPGEPKERSRGSRGRE